MDSKLLALVATIALISGSFMTNSTVDITNDFSSFKATHNKAYATAEEEAYRFAVFTSNA